MISVVIPVYNREGVIEIAIRSVLNQTYKDFELIIVDDCSTDKTMDVVNSFEDNRIRMIQMPKNSGAAAARNMGIINTKADLISLLDSDDFYEPNFLEESYSILKNSASGIGFMWTGIRTIRNKKIETSCWQPTFVESNYLTFLHALHIGTNSGISIKKKVFESCGLFNEKLPAAEDTDFFLRITQHFGYVCSPKILININKSGDDRLSKNYKKIATAYNLFLPQHFSAIDKSKKLQKKFFYKMMWLNYHLSSKSLARFYFKKLISLKLVDKKTILVCTIFELFSNRIASKLHLTLSN
jgi:glycosyltransferase involved in cell wall biosynthesis